MKLKNLLFIGLASAVLLAGCKKDEVQESPSLTISEDSASLQFSAQGGESETQTITFTANRSWTATCDADWVIMDPKDGPASSDPQTITVYVTQNEDFVRSATITLTAGGVVNKTVSVSQDGKEIEYTSIAGLRAMAKDTQTPVKIEGSVFIKGVVISDKDELNNISEKNVFIQDETAGIQLRFASAGTYSRGDELSIDATGLTIAFYGDMYQLVASSSYNESEEKWESTGMPATAVTRLSEDNEIVAKQITLQDLLGLKYESQYVEITTPVQVSEEDLGKTFVEGDEDTNIKFTDADYNTFVVRSEKYSYLLKETEVPEGSGLIKGIATRYGATPQIVFSTVSDWSGLTDARFDVDAPDPAPDDAVYYNDFDKEKAVETSGKWPYLDQFGGWKNETGSGASDVTYDFSGVSVRSNSTSDSNYSDYPGSGVNNILFGTDGHFQVGNIAIEGGNYTLSFGTERYVYNVSDNTFKPEEFHVYISDNGERWVELEYAFPNGFKNGRWDLASSTFTIPSGTSALYIYFASDLSGAHRLDDVALAPAESAGTEIDFSKGTAIGGGDEPGPGEEMTIAEVIAASDDTPVKTSGTVMAMYARGFLISDGTDNLLVFQGNNPSNSPKIGDVVAVSGAKDTYSGLSQIGGTVEFTVTSSEEVTYPDSYPSPNVYGGSAFDAIGDDLSSVELIQYTGTLTKDGTYYNVAVAGASLEGGITYPSSALAGELDALVGKEITVVGYYLGLTNKQQTVSTMLVDYSSAGTGSYFTVSPVSLEVSADATSAKFNINANVDWTVESQSEGFTVDQNLGNGNAEITVSFQANETEQPVSGKVKVSTTADVATKEYTVTITQDAAGASELEVLTIEEFLAKPEGDTYYQLTGTITNITNTTYGNFTLVDETGSVVVWGLTKEKVSSNDKSFSSLGLKEGDVVTLAGTRDSYGNDVQVGGPAYYISHVEGQLPEIKNVSVNEFLSSQVSDLQKYRLTGRIENIVNTAYGNFDLVDETGTVYVYGLKANESADNQSFSELGLKEGDVVTLVGTRGEHNGDPQVANAYYESHVEGLSFSVSPASLSASAEAGTAKFTVTASDEVSWTVSTASDFVTLSDQSGTGTKEIEVTYTANDGADSRTAEITVSTTADVPTKSYTVVLTQNAAGAAESQWTLVSDASELSSGDYVILCDFNNVSGQSGVWALSNAEGTSKNSVKATDISTIGMSENSNVLDGVTEGYIWTFTQSGDGYTLRPKNNDGIGLGVIADNNGLRNSSDYKDQAWSLVKVSDSWGWEMSTPDPQSTTRYLCGYAPDNWRTYKGISNCNTKNWEIRIYKLN